MEFLEVRNVSKSYFLGQKEFKVLDNINLKFRSGEFVSVLGESGGGKTTLMNLIGGLDNEYSGDVLFKGKSLRSLKSKQMDEYRRENIGFIFQNFNLISYLNVLDNVLISLEMTKLSHNKKIERAKALLKKVGLEKHLNKKPNQLSGGQKQRVAIARALAKEPDIIIADEPTEALDSQNTKEVLEVLKAISEEGGLVITVTHSEEVASFGTRVVHLDDGKIHGEVQKQNFFVTKSLLNKMKYRTLPAFVALKMAFKHLKANLKRNSLIIFGTAIGIFSVIIMLGLGKGITSYINAQAINKLNPTAIQVTKKSSLNQMQSGSTNTIGKQDYKILKKTPHVKLTEQGYYFPSAQAVFNKKSSTLQYLQTWNGTERQKEIQYGHKPHKGEILLDKASAKEISKSYKAVLGKPITLFVNSVNQNNEPIQIKKRLVVSGVIGAGTPAITYTDLKRMFEDAGIHFAPNFVTITIDKVTNVKEAQKKIENYKQGNHGRFSLSGIGALLNTINVYIMLAFYVLAAIAGVSLLVSAIMIIVVFYISVTERVKEIGVLRAIGCKKKDIRKLFAFEAGFIGIFSSALGLIFALLIQNGVNEISRKFIKFGIINISLGHISFGIIISVVISLLAAATPARKASKLPPAKALTAE